MHGQATSPAAAFDILRVDEVTPTSAHLTIIEVDTRADADEVLTQIQSGTRFDTLARDYSRHPSAPDGGDLGVSPLADLPPAFRAAITGLKTGDHTGAFAVDKRHVPSGWPEILPLPGESVRSVELALGRSCLSSTLAADANSTMTELTYPFGVRLRVHDTRGLGFMEFTAPWKFSIFGVRPDDPIPASLFDLFPRTGRFIRGVFVGVPGHANWYVDVDDRVDAVTRLLFVDRSIYGNLPDVPKSH